MRFEIISKIVGDKFNSVENDHHDNMKTILKRDYSKMELKQSNFRE